MSVILFLQLIFRKVADVRREKELAERRKNEPQLDQNQDHLVRKIFSKFRRDRTSHQPTVPVRNRTRLKLASVIVIISFQLFDTNARCFFFSVSQSGCGERG